MYSCVSIVGYGGQGRSQALNLRASGVDVQIILRPDSSHWSQAVSDGFTPTFSFEGAPFIHLLIPDHVQKSFYDSYLHDVLPPGSTLSFSHGYALCYGGLIPRKDLDVLVIAPKATGPQVREFYRKRLPVVGGVYQNGSSQAIEKMKWFAQSLGATEFIEATALQETDANLLSEQALIGGLLVLLRNTYESLKTSGHPERLAYFESYGKLTMIAEALEKGGEKGFLEKISPLAAFGAISQGKHVICDKQVDVLLQSIQSGSFSHAFEEKNRCIEGQFIIEKGSE